MSGGRLFVKFEDGEVRYGEYRGTSDLALPFLVSTSQEAAEAYRTGNYTHDYDEAAPRVPVEIATNYGGGFHWTGEATADRLHLIDCDPYDMEYGPMGPIRHRRWPTDGLPDWVKQALLANAAEANRAALDRLAAND